MHPLSELNCSAKISLLIKKKPYQNTIQVLIAPIYSLLNLPYAGWIIVAVFPEIIYCSSINNYELIIDKSICVVYHGLYYTKIEEHNR